jgi:hypothetical protein
VAEAWYTLAIGDRIARSAELNGFLFYFALDEKVKEMPVSRLIVAFTLFLGLPLYAGCSDDQPDNLLTNPGFEERDEHQRAAGWSLAQHAGRDAYKFDFDKAAAASGNLGFRLEQYADQAYGVVKQEVELPEGKGERFRFAAMLKSRDIKERKGLRITLTCLGKRGRVLKQYKSEPLIGTNDWQRVVLEGDIPKGTISLRAGILLQSIGTGWVDDAHLVVN